MNHHRDQPILVIGATGKTGRRLVEKLTVSGHRVRAASRFSSTHFDWDQPATWEPALSETRAVYICYFPDLAFPGAAASVAAFIDLALTCGVSRLVLLSGRGEAGAREAELHLQGSGADWTILRCAFFNQNFDEVFLGAIRHGQIAAPGARTPEPFLDADDIAEVAHAALTDDRHIGHLYDLTGPRLLTFADAAAEISTATGRTIGYRSISPIEFATDLVTAGYTPEEATPIAELFAEVLDGRNAHLTDGVQQALGRAPTDFTHYAQTTAAAGAWNPGGTS